jgi:starch synthase (maltosyl-transferring)
LGTLSSFRRLVEKAGEHGLEIAMDLAFQCSPDHPYVKSHPEWFRRRPVDPCSSPKPSEDIWDSFRWTSDAALESALGAA